MYLRLVLRAMREHNVPPNDIIITQLEHASQYPPNYNQVGRRGRVRVVSNHVHRFVITSAETTDHVFESHVFLSLSLPLFRSPSLCQYKFRNTYLSQIDGFRGYYHQWLNTMPAQETGGPERDHPTETRQDGHQQAAAARRYRKQHS